MKKSLTVLFSLLIFSLFLTSSVFAQKRNFDRGFGQGRIFDKIELTDAQSETIKNLRYDHQLKMIDFQADLDRNRLEIENLYKADKVDESAVMKLVESNNAIHNQLSKMRAEMRLKMNSILTPEQKEILNDCPGFKDGYGQKMGMGYKNQGGRGMFRGSDRDFKCRFGR